MFFQFEIFNPFNLKLREWQKYFVIFAFLNGKHLSKILSSGKKTKAWLLVLSFSSKFENLNQKFGSRGTISITMTESEWCKREENTPTSKLSAKKKYSKSEKNTSRIYPPEFIYKITEEIIKG